MDEINKASYSGTLDVPVKLIQSADIKDGFIFPTHVIVQPTNRCNLKCSFCSTADRDVVTELPLADLVQITDMLKTFGTRAITVSGGGDPTLHKQINEWMSYTFDNNIRCGLVTNGAPLDRIVQSNLFKFDWIRISFDDSREFDGVFQSRLSSIVKNTDIDWGFRYVICNDPPRYDQIDAIIKFATSHRMRYVYITEDIFSSKASFDIKQLHEEDAIVIYENKTSKPGAHDCWVSLLRPTIAADGYVYPCCMVGIDKHKVLSPEYAMCHYRDLPRIVKNQVRFDGTVCGRCYYSGYNNILNAYKQKIQHANFV